MPHSPSTRPLRRIDPLAKQSAVRRILVAAASSPALGRVSKTRVWRMTMWKLERLLLSLSGGRLSAAPGLPTALLRTRGAKMGRSRSTGLIYFNDGDTVIVIASQAGYPGNPSWYHNIRAHPDVTFGGHPFLAQEVVDPVELARLWDLADRVFPAFATYRGEAASHGRTVPVIRLTPR